MSHKNMTATIDDQCMQFIDDGMPLPHIDATSDQQQHHFTPKTTPTFKPIRRRSRASKRTPTTLLKANTSNFRTLVQQFTGCPTNTPPPLAIHKGPITLNFQQSKNQIQHHQYHLTTTTTLGSSTSNQAHHVSVPWQSQPEQIPKQEQQSAGYWVDHVKSCNFLPNSGNSCDNGIDDGLVFDTNDFSLHELTPYAHDFLMS
ncbi:hypothetical protein RJT34_03961 [Clitoria ternatea]|uniref:VQ domain-containing protein n=1 Tax=Clitoria ternatea TaxID=43366 RepID=A0AAN9KN70_CLITE